MLFTTGVLKAQLKEVVIDIHGNYSVIVEVGPETYAEVSEYGELLDIYGKQIRAHNTHNHHHNRRRPQHFPGIDIKYYDNFWEYKAGKVEKIGSVRFDYNSDFWEYNAGKLSRAGTLNISYHNDFREYKSGKVSSIGPAIRMDYHDDFHEEKSGLLKNVNDFRYDYSFPLLRSRQSRQSVNPAMEGQREVRVGDVVIRIVNRL